jgi:hypothetical protein
MRRVRQSVSHPRCKELGLAPRNTGDDCAGWQMFGKFADQRFGHLKQARPIPPAANAREGVARYLGHRPACCRGVHASPHSSLLNQLHSRLQRQISPWDKGPGPGPPARAVPHDFDAIVQTGSLVRGRGVLRQSHPPTEPTSMELGSGPRPEEATRWRLSS